MPSIQKGRVRLLCNAEVGGWVTEVYGDGRFDVRYDGTPGKRGAKHQFPAYSQRAFVSGSPIALAGAGARDEK